MNWRKTIDSINLVLALDVLWPANEKIRSQGRVLAYLINATHFNQSFAKKIAALALLFAISDLLPQSQRFLLTNLEVSKANNIRRLPGNIATRLTGTWANAGRRIAQRNHSFEVTWCTSCVFC